MPNDEIGLGEFVKQLTSLLHHEQIEMPFQNERPWHLLFYDLKRTKEPAKPSFFDDLVFDWDAEYPKSRDLSEFLHALHWNASGSVDNPSYRTLTLSEKIAALWLRRHERVDPELAQFFKHALDHAKKRFAATPSAEAAR